MNNIEISKELLTFIDSSKSMFHTVDTMKKYFDKAGYTFLPENAKWEKKVEITTLQEIIQVY